MPADPRKARELFLHAVGHLPPQRWDGYVAEACGGDVELEQQVKHFLQVHIDAGSFLDRPAVVATGAFTQPGAEKAAPLHERPGAVVGAYKLLEQIGEGGFGVVFLAEQTQPIRRKVALKVLKPGMDSRQVVARFEAERQALALMDHPNIARVFDGGATESGRPYFVMELVKGVPITDYCDRNRLDPRQRLGLFVQVCQAVQHAHQKGIIHRDLKPSNVLVSRHDTTPVVKVIDFGIAKAVGQQLTDKTLFTGLAQMIGTPLYMSPEQAGMSDLDVDTRSDVYSLGVLLYELLIGATPFDKDRFRTAGLDEVRRIIREEEPPKPSTRLSTLAQAGSTVAAARGAEPRKLSRLLRGELDWVVMKALEKDRDRRYETAAGFAADVQRYLSDEPVLACPPSAWYRFRKFARRNKAALAMAGLVLFFIVLLGGVIWWAMRDRGAREQEIALEGAKKLALTEEGIRQALDRATRGRAELHTILKRPGGVQELLNQPARWELFLKTGQGELAQARRLASRAEGGLDGELTQDMDQLEQQLTSDQGDYDLARHLEKVRMGWAILVSGRYDRRKAADEYRQAFAGFGVLNDDPAAVAARLRSSPIKEQFVAALDDWACLSFLIPQSGTAEQLLALARQVAPDPVWGDRMRQLKVLRDQKAFDQLMAEAPAAGLSPQLYVLVGSWLIPKTNQPLRESWLRRAQAEHPADFWVNFHLADTLDTTCSVDAEAGLLGDRAVLLDAGRVLQQGTPADVFRKPASPYVAEFLGAENVFSGTARELGAVSPDWVEGDPDIYASGHRAFAFEAEELTLYAVGDFTPGAGHAVIRAEEITISRDQTHDSARNRFAGRVSEVQTLGALTRVTVEVRGVPLVAALTTRSALELKLEPGLAVIATFKAMAVHLC